ncbi:sigma-54 interaction domain-containing protein [Neptunicella marina]|uniref:Sigma-54-dependent Fis family transcriptional regulator n=1 Tax=Neptunicella marina TaxID=2125989 RepID=A0A8J6LWU6_9ALTE|nr:sigma-54 dependent transcriptional regulator [Neptunicella marina]MBC3765339.1 sigma-54-dependent Fis family transcriptional regulator [Neptunicella marina]
MARPKLFFHLHQSAIEQALLSSDVAKKFLLAKSNHVESWIDQLNEVEANLAVIEVSTFNKQDYQRLLAIEELAEIDLLLLSDGEPNEYLDKAMLRGAGYHFRSPFNMDMIEETIADIYEDYTAQHANAQKIETSDLDQFGLLVGSSKPMRRLYRTVRKVSATESSVLLIGESGAGKELVANTVHLFSKRSEGPFLAINCGALSPELVDSELFGHVKGSFTGAHRDHDGVFEQARGGTLLLDEVTEMPLEQQVKLLRVLESGEFRPVGSSKTRTADVRIVAATNRDPAEAIASQFIREDLYFRLSQFPINVPPLRNRAGDIVGLAKHFLAYRNAKEQQAKQVSDAALEVLNNHNWPGNVRELKHVIERAFILADEVILPEHLILDDTSETTSSSDEISVPTGVPLHEIERVAIEQTLLENDGNKSDTAAQLGISVKTLYNKLEKYQDGE